MREAHEATRNASCFTAGTPPLPAPPPLPAYGAQIDTVRSGECAHGVRHERRRTPTDMVCVPVSLSLLLQSSLSLLLSLFIQCSFPVSLCVSITLFRFQNLSLRSFLFSATGFIAMSFILPSLSLSLSLSLSVSLCLCLSLSLSLSVRFYQFACLSLCSLLLSLPLSFLDFLCLCFSSSVFLFLSCSFLCLTTCGDIRPHTMFLWPCSGARYGSASSLPAPPCPAPPRPAPPRPAPPRLTPLPCHPAHPNPPHSLQPASLCPTPLCLASPHPTPPCPHPSRSHPPRPLTSGAVPHTSEPVLAPAGQEPVLGPPTPIRLKPTQPYPTLRPHPHPPRPLTSSAVPHISEPALAPAGQEPVLVGLVAAQEQVLPLPLRPDAARGLQVRAPRAYSQQEQWSVWTRVTETISVGTC